MAIKSDGIESKKEFADTPNGKYKYWLTELESSQKSKEKWHKQADRIVKRYLGNSIGAHSERDESGFNLNLFHANTKTLCDMMYANTPKIDVSRRYAQAADDAGRVAAEMMERMLNINLADNGDDVDAVFKSALQDRLLVGLGCAKVSYDFEAEEVPALAEDGQPFIGEDGELVMEEKVISEEAPIDYYYWGDILWGWCRNWSEMPWIAFRSYITKEEAAERWNESVAEGLNYKKQTRETSNDGSNQDPDSDSAWQRAEIWEIWCKETRMLHYISIGYDKQLEEKEDILGLSGFWPVPPFFIANVTTSLYTPTPDYALAQDLYNEIDKLQTRIAIITEAVRVVGVYNASADNLKQMMKEGRDNDLIPVDNWALFGENGGMAGQIEWMPLQDIVGALQTLQGIRDNTISLLQQTTGMTDVMRGSLDNQYEGVGQTEAKQKFGSVRIQALQEQFARFASDLMSLKGEVIARHFSPETIYKQANMEFSADQEYIEGAIELIKQPESARLRIEIRPESVAMIDYQAIKNERTEYMNAVSTYFQSSAGIIEADPAAKPFVLQLLQWGLAGFKGASEIEGVMDKAIEASVKAAEEEENKPEELSPEEKASEADSQLEQLKQQGDLSKIQAKAQADAMARQTDMDADIRTEQARHYSKMAEIEAAMTAKVTETQVALQADLLMEQAQAESNIRQTQATVGGEIQKDLVEAEIDLASKQAATASKIQEIAAAATAKISEQTQAAALKPDKEE
tara:strand:+ start:2209 stop:4440 length:2232 start_codon:yes stop_codon:yes gene_type:complete